MVIIIEQLKYASNRITCITSVQYEQITNFLLKEFCPKGKAMRVSIIIVKLLHMYSCGCTCAELLLHLGCTVSGRNTAHAYEPISAQL